MNNTHITQFIRTASVIAIATPVLYAAPDANSLAAKEVELARREAAVARREKSLDILKKVRPTNAKSAGIDVQTFLGRKGSAKYLDRAASLLEGELLGMTPNEAIERISDELKSRPTANGNRAQLKRVQGDIISETNPNRTAYDEFIDTLENNLRVRNDIKEIGKDLAEDAPARFAWTKSDGSPSYYTVDAAVLFTPRWLDSEKMRMCKEGCSKVPGWIGDWKLTPGYEAHISTKAGESVNQIAWRLPFTISHHWEPGMGMGSAKAVEAPSITAWTLTGTPAYVTDRVGSTRTWGADLGLSLKIPKLHVNLDRPTAHKSFPWLKSNFEHLVGMSFRTYEQGADVTGNSKDYGQFTATAKLTTEFFEKVAITNEYTGTVDVWGEGQSHHYFESNLIYKIDEREHFSVGITYLNGEAEPTFERVETVTVWLGVGF